jgi:hypothetical protein
MFTRIINVSITWCIRTHVACRSSVPWKRAGACSIKRNPYRDSRTHSPCEDGTRSRKSRLLRPVCCCLLREPPSRLDTTEDLLRTCTAPFTCGVTTACRRHSKL